MNFRKVAALASIVIALIVTACGASGDASQRRYIADICEPFADYMEGSIEAGFPGFEGVTTPDDMLALFLDLKAVSQTALGRFSRIEPPPDIRDIHEQMLAVLETEIAGYELVEAALRSRDGELLNQALNDADELADLAGIGPTGFFPTDVPGGYEEAWDKECAPRLRQIEDAAS